MSRRPHVRLAIMAKCEPSILLRAVDSARALVDSIAVVIAPRDYATLPNAGLGLPTYVHQVPWGGFAATRTKLYELAGEDRDVDWILMVDADDVFRSGARLPDLERAAAMTVDAFRIPVEQRGVLGRWRWWRNGHLLRARSGFRWTGLGENGVHETLEVADRVLLKWDGLVVSNVPKRIPRDEEERKLYEKMRTDERAGGRTYGDDVDAIRARYGSEPIDTRAAYYYAQSLRDAGRIREAFDAFAVRARCDCGDREETFWSKLWLGKLAREVGEDPVRFFLEAHRYAPERAEPLYALAAYYRFESRYDLAFEYGTKAGERPYPIDAEKVVEVHAYSVTALVAAGIDPR